MTSSPRTRARSSSVRDGSPCPRGLSAARSPDGSPADWVSTGLATLHTPHAELGAFDHAQPRSRNQRRPLSTASKRSAGTAPANVSKSDLSRVAICDALATESRRSPVRRRGRSVLPGALARAVLLVSRQTTTVLIRLALTSSRCNTRAGCRYPGSEPCGTAKSTHQICPRRINGASPSPGEGRLLYDAAPQRRRGRRPADRPRR